MYRRGSNTDLTVLTQEVSSTTERPPRHRAQKQYQYQSIWSIAYEAFRTRASTLNVVVSAQPMAFLRVVYSLILMGQVLEWRDALDSMKESYLAIRCPLWSWIPLPSPAVVATVLGLTFAAALLLLLGLASRISSALILLSSLYITYVQVDRTTHDSALIVFLAFAGCFAGWGTALSVDAVLSKRGVSGGRWLARWKVLCIQLVVLTPYLQRTALKLTTDWLLRAEPVRHWLSAKGSIFGALPLPWMLAWFSLCSDVAVPLLLFQPRVKYALGFPAAVLSCLLNLAIFGLGHNLVLLLMTLLAFWTPSFDIISMTRVPVRAKQSEEDVEPGAGTPSKAQKDGGSRPNLLALCTLVGYILLQVIILATPAAWPSRQDWTEELSLCGWQHKLTSKQGWLYLAMEDPSGRVIDIVPGTDPLLSRTQTGLIPLAPPALLQYAARVSRVLAAAGRPAKSIRALSCVSLNGHRCRELYMKDVDLNPYFTLYLRATVLLPPTAVGRWVHDWESAPYCDCSAHPHSRPGLVRRSTDELQRVQGAAGLGTDLQHDDDGSMQRFVYFKPPNASAGVAEVMAYLWPG